MRRAWIQQLIAGLMLLWALNPENSYGYYFLLRWVCSGIFAYLAVKGFKQGLQAGASRLGLGSGDCGGRIQSGLSRTSDEGDLVRRKHRDNRYCCRVDLCPEA